MVVLGCKSAVSEQQYMALQSMLLTMAAGFALAVAAPDSATDCTATATT
jgi:hypothetical protein